MRDQGLIAQVLWRGVAAVGTAAAGTGTDVLLKSIVFLVHGIEKVTVDANMLLFPLDTTPANWSSLVTPDPPFATRIATFTRTVIDHV